jgi:hypothetical protein
VLVLGSVVQDRSDADDRVGQQSKLQRRGGASPVASDADEASPEQREKQRQPDKAAVWAHKTMPVKNMLTKTDAQQLDSRQDSRHSAKKARRSPGGSHPRRPRAASGPFESSSTPASEEPSNPAAKESSAGRPRLATKTIRLRDKDHRKFVSEQPCVECGRMPADPHHLRFAQPRGPWPQGQ